MLATPSVVLPKPLSKGQANQDETNEYLRGSNGESHVPNVCQGGDGDPNEIAVNGNAKPFAPETQDVEMDGSEDDSETGEYMEQHGMAGDTDQTARAWFLGWFGSQDMSFNVEAAISSLKSFGFSPGSPVPTLDDLSLTVLTIQQKLPRIDGTQLQNAVLEMSRPTVDNWHSDTKKRIIGQVLQEYMVNVCVMTDYEAARVVTRLLEVAVDPTEKQSVLGFGYNLNVGRGFTNKFVSGLYRKTRETMFKVQEVEKRSTKIFNTSTKLTIGVAVPVGAVNAGASGSLGRSKENGIQSTNKSRVHIQRAIRLQTDSLLEGFVHEPISDEITRHTIQRLFELIELDDATEWRNFFDSNGTHIVTEEFYGTDIQEQLVERENAATDTVELSGTVNNASVGVEKSKTQVETVSERTAQVTGSETVPSRVSITVIPLSHLLDSVNRNRLQQCIDKYYQMNASMFIMDRLDGDLFRLTRNEDMTIGRNLETLDPNDIELYSKLFKFELKCDGSGALECVYKHKQKSGIERQTYLEANIGGSYPFRLVYSKPRFQTLQYEEPWEIFSVTINKTWKELPTTYYLTFRYSQKSRAFPWRRRRTGKKAVLYWSRNREDAKPIRFHQVAISLTSLSTSAVTSSPVEQPPTSFQRAATGVSMPATEGLSVFLDGGDQKTAELAIERIIKSAFKDELEAELVKFLYFHPNSPIIGPMFKKFSKTIRRLVSLDIVTKRKRIGTKSVYSVSVEAIDKVVTRVEKADAQDAINTANCFKYIHSNESEVTWDTDGLEKFFKERRKLMLDRYKLAIETEPRFHRLTDAIQFLLNRPQIKYPGGCPVTARNNTYRNVTNVLNVLGTTLDGSPFKFPTPVNV